MMGYPLRLLSEFIVDLQLLDKIILASFEAGHIVILFI